ncbi:MAG: hypothetical protein LBM99_03560 [Bacillales bacterium]|jgi:regulatory protein YycH of two-component signal transduction system YycFG|nr:hypothetical protein [Bacillales bacterium]
MKKNLLVIYILILVILSAVLTFFIWKPVFNNEIETEKYKQYQSSYNELVQAQTYQEESLYLLVSSNIVNEEYLHLKVNVSLKSENAINNIKLLLVDAKEIENKSSKAYPSVGIIDNYNLTLTNTTDLASEKTLFVLEYNEPSEKGFLLLLQGIDDGSKEKITEYLRYDYERN